MSIGVWLVLALLIAANALYVAAEFAAVGVRRSRVQRLRDDGHWLAGRLIRHVGDSTALDTYVGVSQVGITLSSLILGGYAQAAVTPSLAPMVSAAFDASSPTAYSAASVVVLVTMTAAQLVIGELVPKALALQYPTETALATVLPMEWSLVVFRPLLTVLNGTALWMLRVVGASAHGHQHLHSPEEIDLLIAESRDGGLLEPAEQQRLRRALHLGGKTAADLMVPRERLTTVREGDSPERVVDVVLATPFSRLPVYRDTTDHIVGVLRVKDLVDRVARRQPVTMSSLMQPVVTVDRCLPADRVLTSFRDRRIHMAIVTDPDGRAVGLLTIQDLLNELLGHEEPVAGVGPA